MRLHTIALYAGAALLLSGCAGTGSTPTASGTHHHPKAPRTATVEIRHHHSPSPSTPSPTVSSPTPVAGPPTCATPQLRLAEGSVQGAAGSTYVSYSLTNTGATCRMAGYPGFAYLDGDGKVIGQPANRDPKAYGAVTLGHGGAATFVVRTTDPTIPGTGCSVAQRTHWAQVYPPNQKDALRVQSRIVPCRLTVQPVYPAE